jgi:hypothetical protein
MKNNTELKNSVRQAKKLEFYLGFAQPYMSPIQVAQAVQELNRLKRVITELSFNTQEPAKNHLQKVDSNILPMGYNLHLN